MQVLNWLVWIAELSLKRSLFLWLDKVLEVASKGPTLSMHVPQVEKVASKGPTLSKQGPQVEKVASKGPTLSKQGPQVEKVASKDFTLGKQGPGLKVARHNLSQVSAHRQAAHNEGATSTVFADGANQPQQLMPCPAEKDMVRGPGHRLTRQMTLASTDRDTPIDSETVSPLPLSSPPIDQGSSLASCPPRHGKRGKTRGINTDRLVDRFGKLPVEVPMGYTEPVGINATFFGNELGRIIRDMAPLQAGNSWNDIDPSVRESIIQRARDKFDILGYDEDDRVRKAINKKCLQRYTNWRCHLHRFYKKLVKNGKNPKECCYSNVKNDDWIYLIDHVWNDERFTDRSQKCSVARSKLPYNHTCGSRSFANSLFIMEKNDNGKRPHLVEFYKKSHWSKNNNNWVSDECRINHEKLEELRNRCEQEETFMTEEQMSVEVLGARKNYIIGLPGVKRSSSTTAAYAYESDLVKSMKEKIASLEAQNKKNEDFQAWVMSTFQSAGMVQVDTDGVNNENMDGSNIEGSNEEVPTNE